MNQVNVTSTISTRKLLKYFQATKSRKCANILFPLCQFNDSRKLQLNRFFEWGQKLLLLMNHNILFAFQPKHYRYFLVRSRLNFNNVMIKIALELKLKNSFVFVLNFLTKRDHFWWINNDCVRRSTFDDHWHCCCRHCLRQREVKFFKIYF